MKRIESATEQQWHNVQIIIDRTFAEQTEQPGDVVDLLFESPKEIADVAIGKGGYAKNWRSTIRQYLLGCGWAYEWVQRSFEEVRRAL